MKKTVLTFGLISGVIVSAMLAITMPFSDTIGFDRGEIIGYASMLAASLLIYFGIRSYRDNVAGGTVTFGRAFAVGLSIVAVSAALYTATWEVMYFGIGTDFTAKYSQHVIETARKKGATPAELEAKTAQMKKYAAMYKNPFINAAVTFLEPLPVGLIVALISAAALSRKRWGSRVVPAGA